MSDDDQIYSIRKGELRSSTGERYFDFKRRLEPKYWIVYRDIAGGYLALLLCALALVAAQSALSAAWFLTVPAGALVFGFTLAYLNLFFHEAAHTNLATTAKRNDLLADWLIGIFVGQTIESYRLVHFGHHQHHGTPMDTEHSYFDPLNFRFIVAALFGVRAFQVARERAGVASKSGVSEGPRRIAILRGLAFNGALTLGPLLAGLWQVSAAWILGQFCVFPFFNALRQLLEHRDEAVGARRNFAEVCHGRVNRLFGDSALARTLGGAGFNRHLLHHWEPQVSYTRLADLENFVMSCDCGPLFERRRTTYSETFLSLFKHGSAQSSS